MDIAQCSPQNIQCKLLNTVHRIFNAYCNTVHTPINVFEIAQLKAVAFD